MGCGRERTGTEALDVVKVLRRAGGDDCCAGQLGVLDGQRPRRGAPAVYQDGRLVQGFLAREGEFQRLIERLADAEEVSEETLWKEGVLWDLRGDADAQRGSFLETQVRRDLDLDITLGRQVLAKRAVLVLVDVAAVGEAGHAVALLEALGDFAADLLDDTGIV